MRVTVWRQGLATRHTASLCSLATAFHLLTSLLVVVAPLLLAYRSRGFWVRAAEYREQPEVHWRHELLLLAELGQGGQLGWSTEPALAALLGEAGRLPVIRSREEDTNRDGLLDQLTIKLTLPLRPGEEVVAVNTLLVFDVKLHQFSSVQLTGLLHLTGSGFPGSGVHTVGDLRVVQRAPLAPSGRDTRYTASPLPAAGRPEELGLAAILTSYSARNLTTRLQDQYSVWSPGRGSPEFTVSATVRYPVQTLAYTPGLWQVLKWGWVQYLSFLLVFLYLAARVRDFVFGEQVVATLATLATLQAVRPRSSSSRQLPDTMVSLH